MATALMAVAAEEAIDREIRFVVHTLPAEGPSTSILRKLGIRLLGSIQHPEDGEIWKWELPDSILRQDRTESGDVPPPFTAERVHSAGKRYI
jgi:hypothetical protein